MGDSCLMNTVNSLIDPQHLKNVKLLIKNIKKTPVFYTVGLLLTKTGRGFEKDTGKYCQRSRCKRQVKVWQLCFLTALSSRSAVTGCGLSLTRVWARFQSALDAVTSSICLY